MNDSDSNMAPITPFERVLRIILIGLAVLMVGYHLFTVYGIVLGNFEHQNLHLAFILTIVFLDRMIVARTTLKKSLMLIFLLASLGVTFYVGINLLRLEEDVGFPSSVDVVVGLLVIGICIEAARQAWGWTLPIVASVFIVYFYYS